MVGEVAECQEVEEAEGTRDLVPEVSLEMLPRGGGGGGGTTNIESFEVDELPLGCLSGFGSEQRGGDGGVGQGPGVS